MRTKNAIIVGSLVVAVLAATIQTSEAQGRASRGRDHRGSRVAARVATAIVVGGLLGAFFETRSPYYWDDQRYPPYGYPPYDYPPYRYPPYRSRMMSTSAQVRVQIEPSSAEVYVDGYLAGNVSDFDGFFQRLYVSPGAHEIVVYQEGFRSLVRRMYFSPNSSLRIHERLERLALGEPVPSRPVPADDPQGLRDAPSSPYGPPGGGYDEPAPGQGLSARPMAPAEAAVGQVSVRVQPGDADVVIDGELWQRAQGLDRFAVTLPAGAHRVDVRKPGFVPFSTDVTVKAGETLTLNVSLSARQ
ncbi:MAG: PEGA domain-containing protein [Acidobacteriota bacterium]